MEVVIVTMGAIVVLVLPVWLYNWSIHHTHVGQPTNEKDGHSEGVSGVVEQWGKAYWEKAEHTHEPIPRKKKEKW